MRDGICCRTSATRSTPTGCSSRKRRVSAVWNRARSASARLRACRAICCRRPWSAFAACTAASASSSIRGCITRSRTGCARAWSTSASRICCARPRSRASRSIRTPCLPCCPRGIRWARTSSFRSMSSRLSPSFFWRRGAAAAASATCSRATRRSTSSTAWPTTTRF